ncbi:MAG: hypothetical protein IPJ84_07530 [Bdellovibrionales bacterium]|nr:hypothetical protein [Bdellovibrionales bacterium]
MKPSHQGFKVLILCMSIFLTSVEPIFAQERCSSLFSINKDQVSKDRATMITSAQGENFDLEYTFTGTKKNLSGKIQPEWEAKIQLSKKMQGANSQKKVLLGIVDNFGASVTFAGKRHNWGFQPGRPVRKGQFNNRDFSGFYAESLSSMKEFFHDGYAVKPDSQYQIRSTTKNLPKPAGGWVHKIDGQTIYTRATNGTPEELKISHHVGYQFEQGFYFDTADNFLSQAGIALRVKRWSPIDESGNIGSAQAQMLFVKIDRDTQLDLSSIHVGQHLGHRDELQIPIPIDITEPELRVIMSALLKRLERRFLRKPFSWFRQ